MKNRLSLILAALSLVPFAEAQAPEPLTSPGFQSLVPDDPSTLLDLSLEDVWNQYGPPKRMVPVRGDEPWQDDIAFEYSGGFSFFWYRDHLWQIKLSGGYSGSCLGIFVGDPQEKALSLLGQPDKARDGYLEWRLPPQGYPIHLRAIIKAEKVLEIYVYRSDF